ncbi:MAG: hypothetical protein AAB421_01840 [Patescibacteria group bacterium]
MALTTALLCLALLWIFVFLGSIHEGHSFRTAVIAASCALPTLLIVGFLYEWIGWLVEMFGYYMRTFALQIFTALWEAARQFFVR